MQEAVYMEMKVQGGGYEGLENEEGGRGCPTQEGIGGLHYWVAGWDINENQWGKEGGRMKEEAVVRN